MTTDRIAAIREAVTALRKITEQVPNYGMAHAIDLMKDFDLVYANLANLDALEKEREWQPIETAPHETLVLLYWHHALLDDWIIEVDMASYGKLYPNGVSTRSAHSRATHWMPLPNPPTIAGCKQQGDGDE